MHSVRVKICCIQTPEEAQLAIRYGASAIGLVSDMPSGPGVISDSLIAEIARIIPPGVASFLLTSRCDAPAIVTQQRSCGVNTVQMCDEMTDDTYANLRAAMPGVGLVQVVHVTGEDAIPKARAAAAQADAVLLDSGSPRGPTRQLGGTGKIHDWNLSKRIREQVDVPVYLAGGLRPENVCQAIHHVYPFAVDVCSGVRTDGILDEPKLRAFFDAVNAANDEV
jgi:phosphoribosylanthranilate isomerase